MTFVDKRKESIRRRLLAKRTVAKRAGCWLWSGVMNDKGVGKIRVGEGLERPVHRAAGFVWYGWPLTGGYVGHKSIRCDHGCFNPDHLMWFDSRNTGCKYLRERRHGKGKAKKRGVRPEEIATLKVIRLTSEIVIEVIRMLDAGYDQKRIRRNIAERFGGDIDDAAMAKIMVEHGDGSDYLGRFPGRYQ